MITYNTMKNGDKARASPGRSTTTHGRNIDRTEWNTEPTEPIFDRTDLRIGGSRTKFDVESDVEVKNSRFLRLDQV